MVTIKVTSSSCYIPLTFQGLLSVRYLVSDPKPTYYWDMDCLFVMGMHVLA